MASFGIFLMFFVQLSSAILLYVTNSKSESNRWAVFFLLCGSIGAFRYVMVDFIMPNTSYESANALMFQLHKIFFFITEFLSPYGILMYAIVYSEWITRRSVRRVLSNLLALPIVYMLFSTPYQPDIRINFDIAFVWVVPYYLTACFFLVVPIFYEKNLLKRRNRRFMAMMCVPAIVSIIIFNNVAFTFFPQSKMYIFVPIFVVFGFVLFIPILFIHGVNGGRLRLERQSLDHTIRAVTTSSAMLNHAVKERIMNIQMLTDRIGVTSDDPKVSEDVNLVKSETGHLMNIVNRMHKLSRDIVLVDKPNSVNSIIMEAIESNQPTLGAREFKLDVDLSPNTILICDRVHLIETISNMIKNGIEAMQTQKGKLEIKMIENKKDIRIEISDNGRGISKNDKKRIFDPYFSTKNRDNNMGLGLSYCYLVVKHHGGDIVLQSEEGVGTTFVINRRGNLIYGGKDIGEKGHTSRYL
jgi:signal transduction histidine kinase